MAPQSGTRFPWLEGALKEPTHQPLTAVFNVSHNKDNGCMPTVIMTINRGEVAYFAFSPVRRDRINIRDILFNSEEITLEEEIAHWRRSSPRRRLKKVVF